MPNGHDDLMTSETMTSRPLKAHANWTQWSLGELEFDFEIPEGICQLPTGHNDVFGGLLRILKVHANCQLYTRIWLRDLVRQVPQLLHFFDISTSRNGPKLMCFVNVDLEMCFSTRGAIFHFWSGQLAPHPPAWASLLFTLWSHRSLERHSVSRLSHLFAHLHLLSSDFLWLVLLWSPFFFFSLLFSDFLFWLFPSLLFICPYCRNFEFYNVLRL